ncbi:hypothetical protein PQX77_005905 [Marasmius sp. AFHP31]|nr:hypothetical protein PQX77_005905 [Marasmius sp. AFHP31]
MSSNKTPVRKRTRSSGKSTTLRTQSLRSSTADESHLPPDNIISRSTVSNESQQEGSPGTVSDHLCYSTLTSNNLLKWVEIGPPLPSKDPNEMVPEVQDTDAAPSDPTSANEGVLPSAMDKDEGEERLNMDAGTGEQTPLDGTKDNNHTGDEDAADGGSDPMKPTLEKSWEVIMKEVTALDEGLVGGWKEDIDTLLVFAGLFSAVVTAFVIESYQWLQEAPEDTTVALLRQISQQFNNTSEPVPVPDTFTVSSSVVAINVLWFLSLILALIDALFALLCKQWLQEHRRHTHTRTPSEALALRWLRNQSLEKWRVPTILASLPMLLEFALFLFLAGLLELLRTRHPVPFTIATIVVALATICCFGTTIIPAIDIIRQARQVTSVLSSARKSPNRSLWSSVSFIMTLPPMEYICPYKSPQAWAAFQVLRFISCMLLDQYHTVRKTMNSLSDWSSIDLELLQRSSVDLIPPFYELDAFRWLVAELRDSPHMIPHLRNILRTIPIPLHLVMPAVLDRWFFLPGRKWTVSHIDAALDPNLSLDGIGGHLTRAKYLFLAHERQTRNFKRLLHWTHVSMNGGNGSGRDSPPPFSTPFESIDANPDNILRFRLWRIYTEIVQSPAASAYCWVTVMEDLAPYIIASSPDYALCIPTATTTSSFVGSAVGRNFLSNVHSTILDGLTNPFVEFKDIDKWIEAMDIVRRVHTLPEDHFRVFPGHFSLPLSKLKKTLDNLPPTDPEIDFGYLDSFSRGWGNAHYRPKMTLVQILSDHINDYPQSNAESSHCPGSSKTSPLVMSSEGLKLITFVNNRLAKERATYLSLDDVGRTGDWRDAMKRVKLAHPELPPDHFTKIYHEDIDPPQLLTNVHRNRKPKLERRDSEGPSGSPRDVTDTGEVDRDEQTEGRSDSKPSLRPKPRELDERGPHDENGGTHEQGSIPRQDGWGSGR